ncbi:MAG TPA: short-chain dehydrogenase, partial [Caulobacteraceae bacterium]|nr:short-chain dehydrogenase [Caulobacteraceae bacterium]
TAAEFQRGTNVTYLGQVHGVMAALRHMRPRNRGSIVCVGSALAYRSVNAPGLTSAAPPRSRQF